MQVALGSSSCCCAAHNAPTQPNRPQCYCSCTVSCRSCISCGFSLAGISWLLPRGGGCWLQAHLPKPPQMVMCDARQRGSVTVSQAGSHGAGSVIRWAPQELWGLFVADLYLVNVPSVYSCTAKLACPLVCMALGKSPARWQWQLFMLLSRWP